MSNCLQSLPLTSQLLLLPSQVQEMDRIYLAYLQNKNRAEGRRSYKAYLRHLGEIYKSCADSDDPNCVSSQTSRPKPKPEAPKPAPVKTCDPTKDAYCLYAALVQGKSPYLPLVLPAATPAPAPVKAPAPLYVRSAAPAKDPQSGYYYYAPSAASFLTKVCVKTFYVPKNCTLKPSTFWTLVLYCLYFSCFRSRRPSCCVSAPPMTSSVCSTT